MVVSKGKNVVDADQSCAPIVTSACLSIVDYPTADVGVKPQQLGSVHSRTDQPLLALKLTVPLGDPEALDPLSLVSNLQANGSVNTLNYYHN